MGKQLVTVLYLLAMVGLIVGLDVAVLRDHFTARLIVNIGIVLIFIAGYFAFLRPRA